MAKNVAVIGYSESIKGFGTIGLDIFPVIAQKRLHIFSEELQTATITLLYILPKKFLTWLKKSAAVTKADLPPQLYPFRG